VYIAQANALVDVTIPETPTTPTTPTTPQNPGTVLGETTKPVLEITKTVDVEFANPGDTVSYTVAVKNTGDGQALGVSVTDTLPNGFTFADGSGTTKTWFLGAIDVDAQKSIVYDVVIGNVAKGEYQNLAVASADNADSVQATATLEVREPAVLGATVPATGITFRDYAIFISSLLLIAAGTLFIYRGRQFSEAK
jgi:uncharacterized repeat protein (TIGR01451 family)